MLYWLDVYLLVAIGVAVPFLLLYVVGLVFWLAAAAIRMCRVAVRTDFARAHWNDMRRKAA
jgi:hypothetical protein